jgi:hypothetical protein
VKTASLMRKMNARYRHKWFSSGNLISVQMKYLG